MPAEVLFLGGRLDSVKVIGSATEVASSFDAVYADCSLNVFSTSSLRCDLYTSTAGVLSATTVVSGETLWTHFDFRHDSSFTNGGVWVWYDSSNFPWFRFVQTSSSIVQGQYNSGTGASPVWTNVGGTHLVGGSLTTLDFRITLGSPHSFELFSDGTTRLNGTFTQALFTNLAYFTCSGFHSANLSKFSQFALTRDIPTVGAKVRTMRPTANGANTAWAGVFSDVNEAINSDASVNSSGTAAQKETHAMGDLPALSAGTTIKSVWHWMRAKNDGVAPNNIKSVLRSGGVDYATGDLSGMSAGFGQVGAAYDLDPATAAAWIAANVNALEAGYESAT